MGSVTARVTQVAIVETELQFSLQELGHACGVESAVLETLVHEGVLKPQGEVQEQWRFAGSNLPRARQAVRLIRDLELSAPGAALVLDLLDEMESLRAQLRRLPG